MSTLAIIGIVIVGIIFFIWLGLQVKPARFPPYPQRAPEPETIPLPANLPEPVMRFYRKLFQDRIPVLHSTVVSGRATMKPFAGIPFPARFRFTHQTGRNYRHYIELTFFGLPIIRVNERYLDRKSFLELPFGITDEGPKVDQAANLGLWAETSSFPSVYLTDPRVRWESIDQYTAWLIVPFEEAGKPSAGEDRFLVRFDPEDGMIRFMEGMRYRDSKSKSKSLWITETRKSEHPEENLAAYPLHSVGTATWFEQGRPWAFFTTEEIVYNADVEEYIRRNGL